MLEKLTNLNAALRSTGLTSKRLSDLILFASETYIIKPGDSFSRIADGDPRYISLIQEANPGVSSSSLQIGQEITLPPKPISPNVTMTVSNNLVQLLKKYEGKPGTGEPYLSGYDDGFGNITIGWGHNYGKNASNDIVIDQNKAEQLLYEDIEVAASFIRRNVNCKLTQGQFDAMVSLAFNAGGSRLLDSGFFKAVDSCNIEEAKRLLPTTIIGKSQSGLIKRREEELKMFNKDR